MDIIPAVPGTILMRFDDRGTFEQAVPILAWVHVSGLRADPIFPMGVKGGVGVLDAFHFPAINDVPEVFVVPSIMRAFETGESLGMYMRVAAVDEDADITGGAEREPTAEELNEPPAEDMPAEMVDDGGPHSRLHFGAKTYKQTSYWCWPSRGAIFKIEGETPYPSDERVEKITGDEYREHKRSGLVEINPHDGVLPDEPEELEAPRRSYSVI